jgi:hypothetical protein
MVSQNEQNPNLRRKSEPILVFFLNRLQLYYRSGENIGDVKHGICRVHLKCLLKLVTSSLSASLSYFSKGKINCSDQP